MQERTTKQKEFIKEYLKNSYIHPTAFDVLKSAKENNINIGLTSIYRILNKMVEKQEAFSIITKDNIVHYDTNRGDHYHFICTSCNKIIDIDHDIEVFTQLEKRYKINFSSIQDVHIYGLCSDCEKSN
ncbi:MAG: Fur family transcriptional regulator [Bacilli bacterium]|nr:transcriptional repressor [Bacillales bacterium]MDY2746835.1 transcriptional repressor [Bacilli bacterium]MDY6141687.1 transcriptional repressor [Bacilli bacterium]